MHYQIHEGSKDHPSLPTDVGSSGCPASISHSVDICKGVDWLDKWYPPEEAVPTTEPSTPSVDCNGFYDDASQKATRHELCDFEQSHPWSFPEREFYRYDPNKCGVVLSGDKERPYVQHEAIHGLLHSLDVHNFPSKIRNCRESNLSPRHTPTQKAREHKQNSIVVQSEHEAEQHWSHTMSKHYELSEEDLELLDESECYPELPFPSEQYPYPFFDPDFAIPRRPLAPTRVYHFHVIYNHARDPLSSTNDTTLALRFTCALVERLETRGYVNSYFHDRDKRSKNSFKVELERVIAGSSVTILLLTPGFLQDCLELYLQFDSFKTLLGNANRSPRSSTRPRIIIVAVGIPAYQMPSIFHGHDVLHFQEGWEADSSAWMRFDEVVQGSVMKVSKKKEREKSLNEIILMAEDTENKIKGNQEISEKGQRSWSVKDANENLENESKEFYDHAHFDPSSFSQKKKEVFQQDAQNSISSDVRIRPNIDSICAEAQKLYEIHFYSDKKLNANHRNFCDEIETIKDNSEKTHHAFFEKSIEANIMVEDEDITCNKEDDAFTEDSSDYQAYYSSTHDLATSQKDHIPNEVYSRESKVYANDEWTRHHCFSMVDELLREEDHFQVNTEHREWDPGGLSWSDGHFDKDTHLSQTYDNKLYDLPPNCTLDSDDLGKRRTELSLHNMDTNLTFDSSDLDGFDFTFDSDEADGNLLSDDAADNVDLEEIRRRWGFEKTSKERTDNLWKTSFENFHDTEQRYPLSDQSMAALRKTVPRRKTVHFEDKIWEPWTFHPHQEGTFSWQSNREHFDDFATMRGNGLEDMASFRRDLEYGEKWEENQSRPVRAYEDHTKEIVVDNTFSDDLEFGFEKDRSLHARENQIGQLDSSRIQESECLSSLHISSKSIGSDDEHEDVGTAKSREVTVEESEGPHTEICSTRNTASDGSGRLYHYDREYDENSIQSKPGASIDKNNLKIEEKCLDKQNVLQEPTPTKIADESSGSDEFKSNWNRFGMLPLNSPTETKTLAVGEKEASTSFHSHASFLEKCLLEANKRDQTDQVLTELNDTGDEQGRHTPVDEYREDVGENVSRFGYQIHTENSLSSEKTEGAIFEDKETFSQISAFDKHNMQSNDSQAEESGSISIKKEYDDEEDESYEGTAFSGIIAEQPGNLSHDQNARITFKMEEKTETNDFHGEFTQPIEQFEQKIQAKEGSPSETAKHLLTAAKLEIDSGTEMTEKDYTKSDYSQAREDIVTLANSEIREDLSFDKTEYSKKDVNQDFVMFKSSQLQQSKNHDESILHEPYVDGSTEEAKTREMSELEEKSTSVDKEKTDSEIPLSESDNIVAKSLANKIQKELKIDSGTELTDIYHLKEMKLTCDQTLSPTTVVAEGENLLDVNTCNAKQEFESQDRTSPTPPSPYCLTTHIDQESIDNNIVATDIATEMISRYLTAFEIEDVRKRKRRNILEYLELRQKQEIDKKQSLLLLSGNTTEAQEENISATNSLTDNVSEENKLTEAGNDDNNVCEILVTQTKLASCISQSHYKLPSLIDPEFEDSNIVASNMAFDIISDGLSGCLSKVSREILLPQDQKDNKSLEDDEYCENKEKENFDEQNFKITTREVTGINSNLKQDKFDQINGGDFQIKRGVVNKTDTELKEGDQVSDESESISSFTNSDLHVVIDSSRNNEVSLADTSDDYSHGFREDTEEESGFYLSPRGHQFSEGDSGYFDRHEAVHEIQRNLIPLATESLNSDAATSQSNSITSDYASVSCAPENTSQRSDKKQNDSTEIKESNFTLEDEATLDVSDKKNALGYFTFTDESNRVGDQKEISIAGRNERDHLKIQSDDNEKTMQYFEENERVDLYHNASSERTDNSSNQAKPFTFRTDYSEKSSSQIVSEELEEKQCGETYTFGTSELLEDSPGGIHEGLGRQSGTNHEDLKTAETNAEGQHFEVINGSDSSKETKAYETRKEETLHIREVKIGDNLCEAKDHNNEVRDITDSATSIFSSTESYQAEADLNELNMHTETNQSHLKLTDDFSFTEHTKTLGPGETSLAEDGVDGDPGKKDQKPSNIFTTEEAVTSSWPPLGIPGGTLGSSVDGKNQALSEDNIDALSEENMYQTTASEEMDEEEEEEEKFEEEKVEEEEASDDDINMASYSEEHFKFTVLDGKTITSLSSAEQGDETKTDSANDTNISLSPVIREHEEASTSGKSVSNATDTTVALLQPQYPYGGARPKSYSSLWMPTSPRSEFQQLHMFNIQPSDMQFISSSSSSLESSRNKDDTSNPQKETSEYSENLSSSSYPLDVVDASEASNPLPGEVSGISGTEEKTEMSEESAAEEKEEGWMMGLYKGVCHAISKPDMPYLG